MKQTMRGVKEKGSLYRDLTIYDLSRKVLLADKPWTSVSRGQ